MGGGEWGVTSVLIHILVGLWLEFQTQLGGLSGSGGGGRELWGMGEGEGQLTRQNPRLHLPGRILSQCWSTAPWRYSRSKRMLLIGKFYSCYFLRAVFSHSTKKQTNKQTNKPMVFSPNTEVGHRSQMENLDRSEGFFFFFFFCLAFKNPCAYICIQIAMCL